ncbi:MAG: hypothetical protein U0Q16_15240 [Bryobacteraceae bacterium]
MPKYTALFAACLLSAPALVAQSAGISGPAIDWVQSQALRNRSVFFIYENLDSGFNHSFPSGFFPAGGVSKIHLDAGCVFDATTANGCATNPAKLDRDRGTVMRITFDPLSGAEFAGVNFEEPENYGVLLSGMGYDLRGATQLCFDAYAPVNGFRVEFSVAQKSSGYRSLLSAWTPICINLAQIGVTAADLQSVHYPFSVGTNALNAPAGGTVLLDRIRFEPVPTVQAAALSLPLANQVFGVIPAANTLPGRVPIPPDQIAANLATIYESSLAVLALLARNSPQDQAAAKIIADTFVYAIDHDNDGLPLPVGTDGSKGLHSGYSSGDIALFNDQSAGGAKRGQIRFAGFSASSTLCGPSKFCLVLDGATGGNVAFAILALVEAYQKLSPQDVRYLNAAKTLGNWIYNRLLDTTGTGYGGYYLGYPDQGQPKNLILGKSIENNADIFRAFSLLGEFASRQGSIPEGNEWYRRAKIGGDFVMALFDSANGRFYAGTVPLGTTASDGITPTGATRGNDVINTFDFLDAQTFTTLPLATSLLYRNAIDWRRPVQWMIDHQAKVVSAAGTQFQGFNLVTTPSQGPQGIAWEFTGQAIVTMRLVDALYNETRFKPLADLYVPAMRKAQTLAPFSDSTGIVASTMEGGDTLLPYQQCMTTPFQCIASRVGMAASTWGAFADLNVNPFGSHAPPTVLAPLPNQQIPVRGVTFQWTRALGATGYGLRITQGANTVFDGSLSGELLTSTLISLDSGSYGVQVRACNGGFSDAQCGPFSAPVSFTVAPQPPPGLPAITAPAPGQTFPASTIVITWTAVAGAARYEVEVSNQPSGNVGYAISNYGAPPPTSTVVTLPGGNYSVRVRACIEACGAWSTSVPFIISLPPAPTAAPGSPSCSVSSGNQLTCGWSSVASADFYLLQAVQPNTGPGGGALTVLSRYVNGTALSPVAVPIGPFFVFIGACNGNGCGPNTTPMALNATGSNPAAPLLGNPLSGATTSNPVFFSWNRIPGDNGSNTVYRLFVLDLSRSATALDVLTTSNFYSASFKAAGSRYDAVVVANPDTAGQVIGPASAFVALGASPASPTMVQPRHQTPEVNSTIQQGNIQLGWTPVPSSTLYEYFVAVSGQSSPTAHGVTQGLVVQVPLSVGFGGTPQNYSGIVRACQPGLICNPGSETNWGPWSNAPGQGGVTNFRIGP